MNTLIIEYLKGSGRTLIEVEFRHLRGGTEENHEHLSQDIQSS
jgi:hypothetical protein